MIFHDHVKFDKIVLMGYQTSLKSTSFHHLHMQRYIGSINFGLFFEFKYIWSASSKGDDFVDLHK